MISPVATGDHLLQRSDCPRRYAGSPHQIVVADRAIGLGEFATRSGPVGNQKSKFPSLLWVLFIGRVAGDACKA